MADYVIMDVPFAYNIIIGSTLLNFPSNNFYL